MNYYWMYYNTSSGILAPQHSTHSPYGLTENFDSSLIPNSNGLLGPYDDSGNNNMPNDFQTAYNNPQAWLYQNSSFVNNPSWSSIQLQTTKNSRIAYLNLQYMQSCAKGFTSSALGTLYTYGLSDSDEKEWKALNVAITRNAYPTAGYALKCYDSTGAVQYITHTQAQAEQVLLDGSTFGLNQLSNLRTKTNNVNAVQLANYATLQDAENAVNAITY